MLFRLQSYAHYYIGLVIIGHKTNRKETPPFIFLTSKNFFPFLEKHMKLHRKDDKGIVLQSSVICKNRYRSNEESACSGR